MSATVHRFPKWLHEESYVITHDKRRPAVFRLTLVRAGKKHVGFGRTISVAAKRAAKNPGK